MRIVLFGPGIEGRLASIIRAVTQVEKSCITTEGICLHKISSICVSMETHITGIVVDFCIEIHAGIS